MTRLVLTNIVAVLLLLTGCKTATLSSSESPARIPVHSQESLKELRATIKTALNDRDTLIGTTAFTTSPRILITRRPIKGPNGRVIDTRVEEAPIVFRLLLKNKRCYLVDTRNSERYELRRAKCEPV